MQDILCFAKAGLPHACTRRPNVPPRRLHPWPFRALVPKTRTPDVRACVVRVQAERNRLLLLLQGKRRRWMRDHNDGHYTNHHHDDRLDHPHSPDHHHDHPRAGHHDHDAPPHHHHLPNHHDHAHHDHHHHHDHDYLHHLDHYEHHHDHPGADHHDHDNLHHDHPGATHHDHADHDHHDAQVGNDDQLDTACGVRDPHGEPGLVKHTGECLSAVHQRHAAADGLARGAIPQSPRQPPQR